MKKLLKNVLECNIFKKKDNNKKTSNNQEN